MAVVDGGGNVGFKVTAKPKPKPSNHTYENGNEKAAGYANRDQTYIGQKAAEQDFYNANPNLNPYAPQAPAPKPTAPAVHHSGGGGGGGAPARPALDLSMYDQLAQLAAQQSSQATVGANQAVAADRDVATRSYGELDKYLAGLTDPYAHIAPAAAAQVDPTKLAALMRSQGGGDAGLMAQAQFLQANNNSYAAQQDRLAQMLSAAQQASNQSTQAAGKIGGQQVQDDLSAQLRALLAGISSKGRDSQMQIAQQRAAAQDAYNQKAY